MQLFGNIVWNPSAFTDPVTFPKVTYAYVTYAKVTFPYVTYASVS